MKSSEISCRALNKFLTVTEWMLRISGFANAASLLFVVYFYSGLNWSNTVIRRYAFKRIECLTVHSTVYPLLVYEKIVRLSFEGIWVCACSQLPFPFLIFGVQTYKIILFSELRQMLPVSVWILMNTVFVDFITANMCIHVSPKMCFVTCRTMEESSLLKVMTFIVIKKKVM